VRNPRLIFLVLRALSVLALLLAVRTARADEATALKIGTLAPAESPWGQVFKVWAKGVSERTHGALSLQFYWNGQQGDEGAMPRPAVPPSQWFRADRRPAFSRELACARRVLIRGR
jgi:hypothetical protein